MYRKEQPYLVVLELQADSICIFYSIGIIQRRKLDLAFLHQAEPSRQLMGRCDCDLEINPSNPIYFLLDAFPFATPSDQASKRSGRHVRSPIAR
jgi:hypothetical protein